MRDCNEKTNSMTETKRSVLDLGDRYCRRDLASVSKRGYAHLMTSFVEILGIIAFSPCVSLSQLECSLIDRCTSTLFPSAAPLFPGYRVGLPRASITMPLSLLPTPHPSILTSPFPSCAPEIQRTLLHLSSPISLPSFHILPSPFRSCILLLPSAPLPPPPYPQSKKSHIPNQHLPQRARALTIHKLLRARQLDIHIAVHTDQTAFVFRLAPFQADDDGFVDTVWAKKTVSVGSRSLSLSLRMPLGGRETPRRRSFGERTAIGALGGG